MHIIDGKALATDIRKEVTAEVAALGRAPRLNVLLVGDDPASHVYVALKKKAGEECGIRVDVHHFEASASDASLIELIECWNRDPDVDAILVQVPLPYGHDQDAVTQSMSPKKDADGFHPSHVEALLAGRMSIIPPVHEGILRLINETPLKLSGAQIAIIANSDTFSRPLARLLKTAGASVDVMPPGALDAERLKEADAVITAVGRLDFITPDIVKDDVVLIDVGTNKLSDGKVRGDVAFEAFKTTDAWVTPVPGGVGPMTIAQLLKNVVRLASPRA